MKSIHLKQTVKIDGVDHEPGLHSVEDGYADSLVNAGWATPAKGKPKSAVDDEPVDETKTVDDDAPVPVGTDDDKPVDVPAPKPVPKRSRKR
jgi:hypothetical protein